MLDKILLLVRFSSVFQCVEVVNTLTGINLKKYFLDIFLKLIFEQIKSICCRFALFLSTLNIILTESFRNQQTSQMLHVQIGRRRVRSLCGHQQQPAHLLQRPNISLSTEPEVSCRASSSVSSHWLPAPRGPCEDWVWVQLSR